MLVVQENPFRKIGSREIDPPHSSQQKRAQDIDYDRAAEFFIPLNNNEDPWTLRRPLKSDNHLFYFGAESSCIQFIDEMAHVI